MADGWWLKEFGDEMRWHGDNLSNQINWYAQQLYNQQNPQAQELAKTLFGNVNNLSGMSNDMFTQMQGFLGYDNPLSQIGQYLNTAGQTQRDTGRGVYRDAAQVGNQLYGDATQMGNQIYGDATRMGDQLYNQGLALGKDIRDEARNTGDTLAQGHRDMGNQLYNSSMGLGQSLYDQNAAKGQMAYDQGLAMGNQGLALMQGLANQALSGQGAPTAAGFERGTTKAGQYADQMMAEYNSTYRPAAQKAINDAMNFNTQAYREGLAQQTAGTYGRQAANANEQMMRDLARMGAGGPNSGKSLAMRNQNALVNARDRAGALTQGNMMAQEQGRKGLLEAMSNQAGSHLLQGANAALGTEASVTNANTAASADVTKALMDAQNRYRDTSLSTAYNALNSGLTNQNTAFNIGAETMRGLQGIGTTAQTAMAGEANKAQLQSTQDASNARLKGVEIGSNAMRDFYNNAANAKTTAFNTGAAQKANLFNTGADAKTTAFNTGVQGLMKGGDQWLEALKAQGLLQSEAGKIGVDMGKLGIDAAAGANNSALTGMQIGAYPTNQLIQNLLAGFGPRQWGMESVFNAENIHKGLSAADDGRHGALLGQIISAVGSMFGGPLGGTIGSAIGGGLGGGGGGAYSYQGTRW